MKIGYTGMDLPEGKVKYNDPRLAALAAKDNPKKITPWFCEFIPDECIQVEAIVIPKSRILDLLILDMEQIEGRLERSESETEKELVRRCLGRLEEEIPLCDMELPQAGIDILKSLSLVSLKPVLQIAGDEDIDTIISLALDKAGYMFFYTSGPTESHAWLVKKGTPIVECAGCIHSDLERGFIKGDVVEFEAYLKSHSFNTCKQDGTARLVNRDYIVQPGEVIEIRFSV